jgi:hypothetical protein
MSALKAIGSIRLTVLLLARLLEKKSLLDDADQYRDSNFASTRVSCFQSRGKAFGSGPDSGDSI